MGPITFLRLIRVPLVLTAVTDSVTGFLLVRSVDDPLPFQTLGLLAGVSACLYSAGMALNDVADVRRDRKLFPARPIPSGKTTVRGAALLGFLLMSGGFALAYQIGEAVMMTATAMALGILLYNFLFKHISITGALGMGAVRGLNLTLGIVAARFGAEALPGDIMEVVGPEYWFVAGLVLYVIFLTAISTLEEKESFVGKFRLFWIAQMIVVLGTAAASFPNPHPAGLCVILGLSALLFLSGQGVLMYATSGGRTTIFGSRQPLRSSREAIMGHVLRSILFIILLDASFLLATGKLQWGIYVLAAVVPSYLMGLLFRRK